MAGRQEQPRAAERPAEPEAADAHEPDVLAELISGDDQPTPARPAPEKKRADSPSPQTPADVDQSLIDSLLDDDDDDTAPRDGAGS